MACYLNNLGIVNALGGSKQAVMSNLFAGSQANISKCTWIPEQTTYVAAVADELPSIDAHLKPYFSRNNQLALHALIQLQPDIEALKRRYGAARIAVVIGTSTSGITEAESAVATSRAGEAVADDYCYQQIEVGSVAEFVALYLGLSGPAYTISTACSSSGHAFNSAMHLLKSNSVDAVICGGVDSLCRLTVNGFSALESVSNEVTTPFSRNRKGINIGEGAALFVVTREQEGNAIELMGVGASSDAHHISAPEPNGVGAERAIRQAMNRAQLSPSQISYINLHGTGTRLNDAMESGVTHRIFGSDVPASSSKGQIGHTLGAAAASEVGLCWLALLAENEQGFLPPHLWDGYADHELKSLNLVECGKRYIEAGPQAFLSSSFAFGGNNAAVIIGRR